MPERGWRVPAFVDNMREIPKAMNTQRLIILTLSILVLLLGGAFVYMFLTDHQPGSADPRSKGVGSEEAKEQEPDTPQEEAKSDAELIKTALGEEISTKCDYEQNDSRGTVYLKANGYIRIDETTRTGTYHTLKLRKRVYTWSKGSGQGDWRPVSEFKTRYKPNYAVFKPNTLNQGSTLPTATCQKVSGFKQKLFTPPSNVYFESPSEERQTAS